MTTSIDRATLDRLIALGRERGQLTADDLQRALPIDTMDVDALVLVMLELDAAGVGVEPDAFGPRGERPAPDLPSPERSAPATPAPATAATFPTDAARAAGGASGGDGKISAGSDSPAEAQPVDRIVLLSGLAAFAVLAGILLLL